MNRPSLFPALAALALTCTLLCCTPAFAKKPGGGGGGNGGGNQGTLYDIVKLDDADGAFHNGVAYDVNNVDEAVGYVDDAVTGTGRYAAHWFIDSADGVTGSTLAILDQGIAARGINDAGEIVGQGEASDGALVGMYWAGPAASPVILEPLPGHDRSHADAINQDGIVCGRSLLLGDPMATGRAVVWRVTLSGGTPQVTGPIELPAAADGSYARAINENDANGAALVAGGFDDSQTPVVWTVDTAANGSLTVSEPLALDVGAETAGVNDSNVVCGQQGREAVLWNASTATTLNRPTKGKNAAYAAGANDISNAGVVVGFAGPGLSIDHRAVVWKNAGATMTYLDSFLDDTTPLAGLSDGHAVNESGVIVGGAWDAAFAAIPRP